MCSYATQDCNAWLRRLIRSNDFSTPLALLALVGQTRIEAPEVITPEVLARLHRVPDAETRQRLFTVLMALLPEEEYGQNQA